METEVLTLAIVQMIQRAAGMGAMVIDWNIDYTVGAGIIGPREKCLWSQDGKRISCVLLQGGGWIISQSKEPDPVYATLERKWPEPEARHRRLRC